MGQGGEDAARRSLTHCCSVHGEREAGAAAGPAGPGLVEQRHVVCPGLSMPTQIDVPRKGWAAVERPSPRHQRKVHS